MMGRQWNMKCFFATLVIAIGFLAVGLSAPPAAAQGCSLDSPDALEQCRQEAERGEAWAMFVLGVAYGIGKSARKDYREAARWYRKAADKGDAAAMYQLGAAYRDGKGVRKDQREAVKWFFGAADKGDADAYYSLAQAHEEGWGVARDREAAASYMLKSLRGGDDFAVKEMAVNATAWSRSFRRELQRLMKEEGVYSGAIDGSFGPATRRAIRELAARGPAGPATQDASGSGTSGDARPGAPSAAADNEYGAWSNAVARDTAAAYRDYLRRFSSGAHASDVRQRLRRAGSEPPREAQSVSTAGPSTPEKSATSEALEKMPDIEGLEKIR